MSLMVRISRFEAITLPKTLGVDNGEIVHLHRVIQVLPHELQGEHAVSPHLEDGVLGHQALGPG